RYGVWPKSCSQESAGLRGLRGCRSLRCDLSKQFVADPVGWRSREVDTPLPTVIGAYAHGVATLQALLRSAV
ncbi:MAG: hypothetical protein QGI09_12420, partial [Dehalococcoidia bacterium]|nr:hypothetical protein [Dehalococcoidia bacterium]